MTSGIGNRWIQSFNLGSSLLTVTTGLDYDYSRDDRQGYENFIGTALGVLVALLDALTKAKPATSKGVYLRKVAVSSTMGVGVRVDMQSISA